jgi:hypothetical protein
MFSECTLLLNKETELKGKMYHHETNPQVLTSAGHQSFNLMSQLYNWFFFLLDSSGLPQILSSPDGLCRWPLETEDMISALGSEGRNKKLRMSIHISWLSE